MDIFLYNSFLNIIFGLILIMFATFLLSPFFLFREENKSTIIYMLVGTFGFILFFAVLSSILRNVSFFNDLYKYFDTYFNLIKNFPFKAIAYLLGFYISFSLFVGFVVMPIVNFPKNSENWDKILPQFGGSKYKFVNILGLVGISILYCWCIVIFA
ncbi:MAG: hypothetical protein IPP61_16805 [Cytophagaceae bacterium]|nr:hypothetical protein [Cytophagaceae bacterium]MBL0303991.1 hypothetical protein [Cytophagaceae bacterium]MBL0326803.1 hypothetical protein [Cytophagaceae bacterium]